MNSLTIALLAASAVSLGGCAATSSTATNASATGTSASAGLT